MTYSLKLDEREFHLILDILTKSPNFDIFKPMISQYDGDVRSIDFTELLEFGNAYLLKCCGLDEEKNYDKLNVETHILQKEENDKWLEDYVIEKNRIRMKGDIAKFKDGEKVLCTVTSMVDGKEFDKKCTVLKMMRELMDLKKDATQYYRLISDEGEVLHTSELAIKKI